MLRFFCRNSLALIGFVCWALAGAQATEWPRADLAPDPAVRLGVLPNGMRYAIMPNRTPAGAVSVRFSMAVGSMNEAADQRGFSHFVEHMAFRGSRNFPDGELNRTLERLGLRFGADTNATTRQTETVYMFDLPDSKSIADALAITRDIAGNVTFAPQAVETEAGVVMSEAAMRATPSFHSRLSELEFVLQDPRAGALPGGDSDGIVKHPAAPQLLQFYRAYYRPERAVLTVVGDVDPDRVAAQIAARFADWSGAGQSGSDPVLKVPTGRGLEARIHVETASPTQVVLTWVKPLNPHPIDRESWKHLHVTGVALQIANRRLATMASLQDRPFVNAQASLQEAPRAAELVTLSAGFDGGNWQKALVALAQTRQALLHTPVLQSEIDSAVAAQGAARQREEISAQTRTTPALANSLAAAAGLGDIIVSPALVRAASDEDLTGLTPDAITQVLQELFGGGDPLIFVTALHPVDGGEKAITDAYLAVDSEAKTLPAAGEAAQWPYTSFGAPGRVVDTNSVPDIGVTVLRFSNNVRLLVHPSKLRLNQVLVSVKVGNGRLDLPKDRAIASWFFGGIVPGGLGALSFTEIQAALSGKSYRIGFAVGDGAFAFGGETTSQDLATQLQIFAAYIHDPGFRRPGFEQYKQQSVGRIRNADATPGGVIGLKSVEIFHAGDKRWASPDLGDIRAAAVDDVQALARPMLAQTPIDVIIAGDTSVEEASRAVALTLGALPARPLQMSKVTPDNNTQFPSGAAAPVVLQTSLPSAQNVVSVAWATRGLFANLQDDAAIQLLAAIMRERLLDAVRGQGLSYAVQVVSPSSAIFDYGYFAAAATMPIGKAQIFYDAADQIAADLKAGKISADEFNRCRAPTLQELYRNIQTNEYWLNLMNNGWDDQARFNRARNYQHIMESLTPADLAAAARKYLTGDRVVRIVAGS
jgi:zinc protease